MSIGSILVSTERRHLGISDSAQSEQWGNNEAQEVHVPDHGIAVVDPDRIRSRRADGELGTPAGGRGRRLRHP